MKKISFVQWFINLIKRDMKECKEDENEKQKIYDSIKRELKD